MKQRLYKFNAAILFFLIVSSCAQPRGNYVPLSRDTVNPHIQRAVNTTNGLGQIVVINYFDVRPLFDTLRFQTGKKVYTWHRKSSMSSCCAGAQFKDYEKYTMRKDTMFFEHCRYIVSGDTLFPLHSGSVFVKEAKKISEN